MDPIIEITAEDSPNVILARRQLEAGHEPTGEIVVRTWDHLDADHLADLRRWWAAIPSSMSS